jgi:Raf kinase inhibitor-like YbhB/YbcL family protein
MQLRSDDFENGKPMPPQFAFARPAKPIELSNNENPHLAWKGAPANTRSFVLTCIDTDVPSKLDDVNKEGRTVPADLPRIDIVHWLMANIPVECGELASGSCSDEVTPRGKRDPFGPPGSVQGVNGYTDWFAGDANMEGTYLGYDGPCPPWNDAIAHHYHFTVYALDVETLPLKPGFTLAQLHEAMTNHVLAQATLTGTYSLNPRISA